MTQRFRIALVGAGLMTSGSHLPAALACPKVVVAAIIDPTRARAEQLAASYGISPLIAERVEDVLDKVDGALTPTPNDSHKAIAVACLEAGVSALIEKPLATTYADGAAIVEATERSGKVVAVGYNSRFRESVLFLGELLESGYFGKVRRFVDQYGTIGGWAALSAYTLSRQTAGGGALIVTGTHFLDRMLHYWGYPQAVELLDDAIDGPEANCVAEFHYEHAGHSFSGVARYSKTARLPDGTVIETDLGTLMIRDADDADIVFRPASSPQVEQVLRRRGPAPYAKGLSVTELQLNDFVDACLEGRPPMVDGQQGLASLRLLEELYARRKPLPSDWYGAKRKELGR